MCSPGEGSRRTETSYFLIKSLELKCHAYVFHYVYITCDVFSHSSGKKVKYI